LDEIGTVTRLSDRILAVWRTLLDRFEGRRLNMLAGAREEELFQRARTLARIGDLKGAAASFEEAISIAPDFVEAVESQGEVLDMIGQSDLAVAKYDAVRRVRLKARESAPDRTFVLRRAGRFPGEIAAYTSVLKSMQRRVLPFIARGNALLAAGRPEPALIDYDSALLLKPGLPEVIALKGEAFSIMRNYEAAVEAFSTALKSRAQDPDILSGRAIALMALGRLDEADADWRLQLSVLPAERASAHACVALRLADYATALPQLERAIQKEPRNLYWRLYRLTALRRLGKSVDAPQEGPEEAWPAPLLALHHGRASEDAIAKADSNERYAETAFQLGILALPGDPDQARRWFGEVIEKAAPAMIEYAAARHELSRLS
jgi:tetratricopeptide (TPR) repeat protein